MNKKLDKLRAIATLYMRGSQDPVHDLAHVTRVSEYASRIAKSYNLSKDEYDTLMLAVQWHDVSRTLTKNTSFILMFFVDDILSAFMLWFWTIRYGLFGSIAGRATRMIFCKGKTPGTKFMRFFMTKRTKLLLQILEDADALDMLHVERTSILCTLSQHSRMNRAAYKLVTRWWTGKDRLKLKTDAAKIILKELLKAFITWLEQIFTVQFHTNTYGAKWANKMLDRFRKLEQLLTY